MILNVATSGDRNVIKTEAEKIWKHTERTVEIARMWSVKAKAIPVIVGASGAVSDAFSNYLSNVLGKHEVKERQATAILATAHTHTAESTNVTVQVIEHGK